MYRKYYGLTRKPFEMRCRLEPIGRETMRSYIRKRLELAGANSGGAAIFPDETIDAVYQFSQGIPRLVDTRCENALISGFARLSRQVQPRIVQEVAADLRLELSASAPAPTAMRFEEGNQVLELLTRRIEHRYGAFEQSSCETDEEAGVKPQ
jgi:hypothetical protein